MIECSYVTGFTINSSGGIMLTLPVLLKNPFCIKLADRFGVFEHTQILSGMSKPFFYKMTDNGYTYKLTRIEEQPSYQVLSLLAFLVPFQAELQEVYLESSNCDPEHYAYFQQCLKDV